MSFQFSWPLILKTNDTIMFYFFDNFAGVVSNVSRSPREFSYEVTLYLDLVG